MRANRSMGVGALAIAVAACVAAPEVRGRSEPPPGGSPPQPAPQTVPEASSAPPRGPVHDVAAPDASAPEPPAEPAVQLVGRFDERDPKGPICGWPGCRIVARFEGSSVRVTLSETPVLDGPSEWDVAVDDGPPTKLVLDAGPHTYVLAEGLAPGAHVVELYKRTEGQAGYTQFLGFDFGGGALLAPPPRRSRHLEIIGDSDVTGFGYEGTAFFGGQCPGDAWAAHWENFRGAWGERLANALNAELHAAAYTGKGFYFNNWRPDTATIGVVYPRANPVDPDSAWDFTSWTADVVVVAVGGNDYNIGHPVDTGPAPLDGVIAKASELTDSIRSHYPQAHIFLVAYAVLSDADPPGRLRRTNIETALKTVRDARNAAGDARVYFLDPPQYDPAELTACDGHGGPAYHDRIAKFLTTEITSRTGW